MLPAMVNRLTKAVLKTASVKPRLTVTLVNTKGPPFVVVNLKVNYIPTTPGGKRT